MSTVDLGEHRAVVPGTAGRVRLPVGALEHLAEAAGQRPLLPVRDGGTVAARLGRPGVGDPTAAPPPAEPSPAQPHPSTLGDGVEVPDGRLTPDLVASGLLTTSGRPAPGVRGLFERWHAAACRVDLDLALTAPRSRRVRVRHRACGGSVVALARSDRHDELAWMPVERWWMELVRCAVVPSVGEEAALPTRFTVPWDTLVATGAAVAAHRDDLVRQLVTGPPGPEAVRLLHDRTRGRLHARVVGARGGAVLEWLLVGDAWHELAPADAGRVLVRRVALGDLAVRVAALVEVVR